MGVVRLEGDELAFEIFAIFAKADVLVFEDFIGLNERRGFADMHAAAGGLGTSGIPFVHGSAGEAALLLDLVLELLHAVATLRAAPHPAEPREDAGCEGEQHGEFE